MRPARAALTASAQRFSRERFAGGLHIISGRIAIEAELDSPTIARRVTRDLGELYGVRPDLSLFGKGAGALPTVKLLVEHGAAVKLPQSQVSTGRSGG